MGGSGNPAFLYTEHFWFADPDPVLSLNADLDPDPALQNRVVILKLCKHYFMKSLL